MKRLISIITLLAVAVAAFCQDTVTYPYLCYLEWPMPDTMGMHVNECSEGEPRWPYQARYTSTPRTRAKQYTVDKPTVIYGIAATLCNQDSLQRDLSVTLFSKGGNFQSYNNYFYVTPVKTVRWTDSMPFRYVQFNSIDYIQSSPTYGEHFSAAVKSYEFYFDTPVVVTDTFFVGYQTLGDDGLQHPEPSTDESLTGWVMLATAYNTNYYSHHSSDSIILPYWRTISDSIAWSHNPTCWAGLFPIIEQPQQPCNPDTLTCEPVPDFGVFPLMSGDEVRFSWHALSSHRNFQISVGPQGTPPDDNPIYEAATPPFALTGIWDSTIYYAAYIRAQCSRYCYPDSTLVWSDWSNPVIFYTGRTPPDTTHHHNPEGINAPVAKAPLFTLTPNPAHNSVTVTVNPQLSILNSQLSISLTDAAGRELLNTKVSTLNPLLRGAGVCYSLPISQYPAGTYFVTLRTPDTASTQRLVIE